MFYQSLLALTLLAFVRAESILRTQPFAVLQDKRLTKAVVVEIKTAPSIITCAILCSESISCCAASYFDGKCQLNAKCSCAVETHANSYVIQKRANKEGVCSSVQRKVVKTLQVGNGGIMGQWGTPEYCESGYFGIGFSIKVQKYQGYTDDIPSSDDTSMNGISIKCASIDGPHAWCVSSDVAQWGSWRAYKDCEKGETQKALTSFVLRVEPPMGDGDDTAVNDIKFKCRDIEAEPEYEISIPPADSSIWGSFGAWSDSCPLNSAICGIQTRVEPPNPKDDTAVNDVKFFCCLCE